MSICTKAPFTLGSLGTDSLWGTTHAPRAKQLFNKKGWAWAHEFITLNRPSYEVVKCKSIMLETRTKNPGLLFDPNSIEADSTGVWVLPQGDP